MAKKKNLKVELKEQFDLFSKKFNVENKDIVYSKLFNYFSNRSNYDKKINEENIHEFIKISEKESLNKRLEEHLSKFLSQESKNIYLDENSENDKTINLILKSYLKGIYDTIVFNQKDILKIDNQKDFNQKVYYCIQDFIDVVKSENCNLEIELTNEELSYFSKKHSFSDKFFKLISLTYCSNLNDENFSKEPHKIYLFKNEYYYAEKHVFKKDFLTVNYFVSISLNDKNLKHYIVHNEIQEGIKKTLAQKSLSIKNKIKKSTRKHFSDINKILDSFESSGFKVRDNSLNLNIRSDKVVVEKTNKSLSKKLSNLKEQYTSKFKNEFIKMKFKDMFPLVRRKNRKFTFFIGETNSGKTYQAFEKLKSKETGLFLSPLRLLALEGYEKIKSFGLSCELLTGEENISDENAKFRSSTIEMLNLNESYDVIVIDECQMIFDKQRGWAWTQAIVGANADEIVLTGSEEALKAIEFITQYTKDELEVVRLEKKTTLEPLPEKISSYKDIPDSTAVICFSKKEILKSKSTYEKTTGKKASVIFGSLSPEVRRSEAERFRNGETTVVFATDAIGMGLNLPIKNVLFSSLHKFNGKQDVMIDSSLAKQIAGRAGRYGYYETGYYGAFKDVKMETLIDLVSQPYPKRKNSFYYKIPFTVFEEIYNISKTPNCVDIINKFLELYDLSDNNFIKMDSDEILLKAKIIEEFNHDVDKHLTLYDKYKLIFSPIPAEKNPLFFKNIIKKILKNNDFEYKDEIRSKLNEIKTIDDLKLFEQELMILDSYNWLSYNFGQIFKIQNFVIVEEKNSLNNLMMEFLKTNEKIMKKCSSCDILISLEESNKCKKCKTEIAA